MKHNEPHWSYQKHCDAEKEVAGDLSFCYSHLDTIDAWRHERMRKTLMPLLKNYPGATWMTIGDGNYASDAYFLKRNGADVLATSLADDGLLIAKEKGFIDKFKVENAEKISESDNSYDFILCKESYHHFPRPAIAFYEMLRVARRALVLIEPQETSGRLFDSAKKAFKRIIRNQKTVLFEEGGNFIYRVNVKEIEKIMTALNYEVIAFKGLNDFYHKKISHSKYLMLSISTLITKMALIVQNILCSLRLLDYGLVCILAFKEYPSKKLQHELKQNKFKILFLPQNPYLTDK